MSHITHIMGALSCTLLFAACSAQTITKRDDPLPDAFWPPDTTPDFSLAHAPAEIERLLRRKKCAGVSSDMSSLSLATGLSSRTGGNSVRLDKGKTSDGTSWYLLRAEHDPDITYCGIAFVGAAEGTNISITGVLRRNIDIAKSAIESGDFLCKCEMLTR